MDSLDHLDFFPTCSVGHPGGSQIGPNGEEYEPCPEPARFGTDVHDHPEPSAHFWCVDHLTAHTLWIKALSEETDTFSCFQCGLQIADVSDFIFNLNVIDSPRPSKGSQE